MIGRSVVRRYAQAAFDLAADDAALDATQRQLEVLQAANRSGSELSRLLRHPTLAIERKIEAIASVLGETPTDAVGRLVALVVDNDRVPVLTLAGDVFQDLADERAGVVRARVTTALPMPDEQAERLRAALAKWRSAPVELETHLDPGLVGGIMVRIGDHVVDASIEGRLGRVEEHLTMP